MDMEVVIVGAGVAGIAAAANLIENGVQNVTILEAEHRVGGRVNTVGLGDVDLDLGAHWVHGEAGNVVYELANQHNMLEHSGDLSSVEFMMSDGTRLPAEIGLKLYSLSSQIMNDEMGLRGSYGSVNDYIVTNFEGISGQVLVRDAVKDAFLRWFKRFECSIEGCDNLTDASAHGLTYYKQCDGDLVLCWKRGGFKNIINLLTQSYPKEANQIQVMRNVKLNKEVVEIDWSDKKAIVRCSDGTEYTADSVIVTVSLGVLKERINTMFTPPLPHPKINAIVNLDIGTVDKIYLKYSEPWWPAECSGFSFLYLEDPPSCATATSKIETACDWTKEVIGFFTEKNAPNVLGGWVVGRAARSMEKCSNAEIVRSCTQLLRQFLGKEYDVPEPIAMIRSAWHSNPHFRGSYSFRSISTEENGTSAKFLAAPLSNPKTKNILLFAGEATHESHYSTVHGAIESGWREATRLLQQKTKWKSSL